MEYLYIVGSSISTLMKRPFANSRPIGPFAKRSHEKDTSWFSKIEVHTNEASEDNIYTVTGILESGGAGLTLETNAIVVNGSDGATITLFERNPRGKGLSLDNYTGDAGLEILAPGKGKVGIDKETRSKDLVNIIIEEG